MNKFNIIALFCQDIREEKDDLLTLVGILPDNVGITRIAADAPTDGAAPITRGKLNRSLSKLCIYLRVNFDLDYQLPEVKMQLVFGDGTVHAAGSILPDVIEAAIAQAKEKGNPVTGVVARLELGGFAPPPGVMKFEVVLGDETHLAGALNFIETATSPNDAQQPS
jgi:hypothetical protein